jgi:hypothetical protein
MPPSSRSHHLLALGVTRANEQDRVQVAALAAATKAATGATVAPAYVDQGSIGLEPVEAAQVHGIRLEYVRLAEAKRGFVLLPRQWVIERDFGWASGFATWPATMTICRRCWQVCTSWRSPASCSGG